MTEKCPVCQAPDNNGCCEFGRDRKDFVISEDGVRFVSGERAYNYYDMEPGTIHLHESDRKRLNELPTLSPDVRYEQTWFDFIPDGGGRRMLNGVRICSLEFARDNGWPGA